MSTLRFPDAEALADLGTFVARARSLDAEGAVRLQARGLVLAAYVGVLPGHGLMADGAVIGMRVMPLAEPAELDSTVPLAGVTDRLARTGTTEARTLDVPPTTVSAGWAAVAPPREGWERVGELPAAALKAVATQGIEEIAQGAPTGSGGHAVTSLRERVWSRMTETVPPVPAGAAFAAYALGFLGAGDAAVFMHGRWTRVSTQAGHVLLR